jgi:hypothetical protein
MELNLRGLRNIKSLLKMGLNYNLIFIVNALILIYASNLYPLSRFPSYDYFWSDSMTVSRLFDIKQAISKQIFPGYNFYSGFGIEKISELNSYQNPLNILNVLLISPLSVINFLIIKNVIFLSLLGFGTAKFLSLHDRNIKRQIFFGITITSVPILWGQVFLSNHFYFICSVPILLWLFEKYKSKNNLIYHLLSILIINMTGPDIVTSMAIFLLYFSMSFSTLIFYKNQIKKSQIFFMSATPVVSTLTYTLPLLNYLTQNYNNPVRHENISISDYVSFIFFNGIHTLIYPKEGSVINLYVPICLYFIVIYLFYKMIKIKAKISNFIKYFCTVIIVYTFLPVIIYTIPPLANLFPSYLRFQFSLWPIFIWILTAMLISQMIIPKFVFIKILFLSLLFELYLFIYNPFDHFYFLNPVSKNYMNFSKWLGTHNIDQMMSNIDILKIPYISIDSEPWLVILFSHGIFLLVLNYAVNNNSYVINKNKVFIMLASILVTVQLFSSYSEVKKYDQVGNVMLKNSYRFTNYENRINKWIIKYDINDSNYRVIASGKNYIFYDSQTARNTKTLPDLELNNFHNIKIPFQYREINSENTSQLYGKLYCPSCTNLISGAFFPPTNEMLIDNSNWLSSASIKFIISADEQIYSNKFKLLDSYAYQKPIISYDYTESGIVYLYEFLGNVPLATSETGEKFKVLHINGNAISIMIDEPKYRNIFLNFEYNSKLQASSDGEEVPILERADGFIEIKSPKNASEIIIIYSNNYFKWSSVIFLIYFVLSILYIMKRKLDL